MSLNEKIRTGLQKEFLTSYLIDLDVKALKGAEIRSI